MEPKKEDVEKWFNDFWKQINDLGYTNKLSRNLIKVYTGYSKDLDPDGDVEDSYENLLEFQKECEKTEVPAFMPVNGSGWLKKPQKDDEPAGAWIDKNSYDSPKDIPLAHKVYLYKKAQDHKLYIDSIDTSLDQFGGFKFITVDENHNAVVTEKFDKLREKVSGLSDDQKYHGFSKDEINNTYDLMEAVVRMKTTANLMSNNLTDASESLIRNGNFEKLPGQEMYEKWYDSHDYSKKLSIYAYHNNEWFTSKEDLARSDKAFSIDNKKEFRKTPDDFFYMRSNGYALQEAPLYEAELFRFIGDDCKSWDQFTEAINTKGITNLNGKPFVFENTKENRARLIGNYAAGNAIWVQNGMPMARKFNEGKIAGIDEVMFGLVGEGCKSWDDVEKTLKDKGYTNPDGSELKIDKSPEGIAKLQSDAAKGKTLWADPDGTPVYVDVRFKRLKNSLTSTVTNAYIDELKFLASSAKKTEKNLTKNSSQYDKFSKLLKELPDAVAGIAADPERCSLPNMREKLKDVLEAGDEYIKAHMNVKKLSDRQVARIKVINRLRDLAGEMDNKVVDPGKNIVYRIAEKLYTGAAIGAGNAKLLMYPEKRRAGIQEIMKIKGFSDFIQNLSPENGQKLLRMPCVKYASTVFPEIAATIDAKKFHVKDTATEKLVFEKKVVI